MWEHEETKALLDVMRETNSLSLFDGKIFKNSEVYKRIKRELEKRGFEAKNEKQIEIRWKNLKRKYIEIKKNNKKSGNERETCPYFEEIDVLLHHRPSISLVDIGIDSSRNEEMLTEDDIIVEDPEPDIQSIPSTSTDEQQRSKRKTQNPGRGSYARSMEKLGEMIRKTQEESNKEFFDQQKKLIDYEFQRYSEKEEEVNKQFNAETRSILAESTAAFLSRIREMFNIPETNYNAPSSGTENIRNVKLFFNYLGI